MSKNEVAPETLVWGVRLVHFGEPDLRKAVYNRDAEEAKALGVRGGRARSCPLGLVSWQHCIVAEVRGPGAAAQWTWGRLRGCSGWHSWGARGAGAQLSHGGCLQSSYLY